MGGLGVMALPLRLHPGQVGRVSCKRVRIMGAVETGLDHPRCVVMVFIEGMERSQSFANYWYRSEMFHYVSSSWSGWITQSRPREGVGVG